MNESLEGLPLALAYAATAHASQRRKGKEEPYLSHVLAVVSLVLHYGGTEEQAMAAALHDVVEDQGGQERLDDVERVFGPHIAQMVLACTDFDTSAGPRPPWRERKDAYLQGLSDPDPFNVRLVEACDKLANLRDIIEDVRRDGSSTLERFSGGTEGVLWYYSELRDRLVGQMPQLGEEFSRLVDELESQVQR